MSAPSPAQKSPAAVAPLTFCAAGVAVLNSAVAEITVLDVGVTLNAAISTQSLTTYVALQLPGGRVFNIQHLGVLSGTLPIGGANAVPGASVSLAGFAASGYNYAFNLGLGTAVSQAPQFMTNAGTMAFSTGFPNEQFTTPGIGYLGFRFDLGNGPRFGWAEVNMSGTPLNQIEVLRYALGDVGDQVRAGLIPEPSSLALLALGAGGVLAQRRRRKNLPAQGT